MEVYRATDTRLKRLVAIKDSFRPDKHPLWSEELLTDRGSLIRNFDLHPDGVEVVLGLNIFDELRRLAPPSR